MAKNSKIEWCHHTFNPWIGCTKVSPGCANCYAEKSTRARVLRSEGHETWGKGAVRSLTSEANWKQPLKWNREAELDWENWTLAVEALAGDSGPMPTRPRVFCASLADWLDDEVPIEWLARLLQLIHDTPNLDWLLLTKRPENWLNRIDAIAMECPDASEDLLDLIEGWTDCIDMPERGQWPENVWIGTTVEDQTRADERIPQLLAIPAAVRFLSCEPLLSKVDLVFDEERLTGGANDESVRTRLGPHGIHWVICGGESGPNARPMHPHWARSLRDQCHAAGVPFLFKQWGDWVYPAYADPSASFDDFPKAERGKVWHPTGPSSRHGYDLLKLGKKKAGRLLDGIEHNEFPIAKGARA